MYNRQSCARWAWSSESAYSLACSDSKGDVAPIYTHFLPLDSEVWSIQPVSFYRASHSVRTEVLQRMQKGRMVELPTNRSPRCLHPMSGSSSDDGPERFLAHSRPIMESLPPALIHTQNTIPIQRKQRDAELHSRHGGWKSEAFQSGPH